MQGSREGFIGGPFWADVWSRGLTGDEARKVDMVTRCVRLCASLLRSMASHPCPSCRSDMIWSALAPALWPCSVVYKRFAHGGGGCYCFLFPPGSSRLV